MYLCLFFGFVAWQQAFYKVFFFFLLAARQVLESPHGSLDLPLVLEAEGAARRRGTPAVLMARSAEDHQR